MKLSAFFSKPRWQSKDPAVRRAAVANERDPSLVADLPRFAREDEDAGVRAAAMRRLADPGLVQGMARDDADAEVRKQARTLWFELMSGTHAAAPPLADRVRLLKAQDDVELIDHLARRADAAELRMAALQRVQRPALLLESALEDRDAAIRLAALARIEDEAQLERVAERSRKTDKQINRLARERIEALRIARGDQSALVQRARALCESLDNLLRDPQPADVEAALVARWNEIEPRLDDALKQRWEATRRLLVASRMERPVAAAGPIDEREVAETVAASSGIPASDTVTTGIEAVAHDDAVEPATETAPESTPESTVNELLAQARFNATLDSLNAEREQQRERQKSLLTRIESAMGPFEAALDGGSSVQAHARKGEIDALRRDLDGALPRALAQRLAAAEQRHAEFSRWQHWADSQRRLQICEEIEALPSAGLHPDAVAARVREAQAEWTRLDTLEGDSARRAGGLGRRFHAACRAALEPARAYFKKRHELRESQAQRIGEIVDRANALDADATPAQAIAMRREITTALRDLDRIEPRERKALAERLKQGLAALDARIAAHDEQVAAAKQALIARAEALTQPTLQRGAAGSARELQQLWQAAGNGRRARDQAQWQAFRSAIDAVFKGLDADRAERHARDDAQRQQAEALCAEIESLAASGADADRAAVTRLDAAWSAFGRVDDALRTRFDVARATLHDAANQRVRAAGQARFRHWLERYRLCREAEQDGASEALRAHWDAAAATDVAREALVTRFDRALGGNRMPADADSARDLMIELEMFAGIDSPEAERERRRVLQIDKLSSRLRGDAAVPPDQELTDLLTRWTDLGAGDTTLDSRVERALAATLDNLP